MSLRLPQRVHTAPARTAIYGMALLLAACVSPPHLVGKARPPIPVSSVVVYPSVLTPPRYEVIAKLDATGLGGFSSPNTNQAVIARLKAEAARLGANGVLLEQHGQPPQLTGYWPRAKPEYSALAIYVPPSKP